MPRVLLTALAASAAFATSVISSQPSSAQTRPMVHHAQAQPPAAVRAATWPLAGMWLYRSYHNRPDVVINDDKDSAAKALSLLFGEGVMTLTTPSAGKIAGTFDMGGGYVLDLTGTVTTSATGRTAIHMVGPGRPNTPTAGWEYDYDAVVVEKWPKGVNQIPAIVGSVFRAKPHGPTAPAGVVGSFIAVKQP